jgi:hypothetical protein
MGTNKTLIFLLLLWLTGCAETDSARHYLFLGHPYRWVESGDRVDPRVEALPLNTYDQVWLGGDLCAKTTAHSGTLAYLDSLFQFANGNVHWAWGNHDVKYGNEEWLVETTGKPDCYAEWLEGLLLVVLNTNLLQWPNASPPPDFCRRMEEQYALLEAVADTTRAASHVVILHHYGLLTDSLSGGGYALDTIFNYYKPFLKWKCSPNEATFAQAVYPMLVRLQTRGIQVVLTAGDLGQRAKQFAWQSPEGIWFLGSGINNSADPAYAPDYVTNFDPDKVLVFRHDPKERRLDWSFQDLDSLRFARPQPRKTL